MQHQRGRRTPRTCAPRSAAGRWIRRRGGVAGLTVLLLVALPGPGLSQQSELDPKQAAQARSIEAQLIAPCCFRQTVAEHQSPQAESVRAEVRRMLDGGAREQEVVDFFVNKYGEAILAAPRARGFNLIAYLMPVLAFGIGLAVVAVQLRRWRRAGPPRPDGTASSGASASPQASVFRDQLEAELAAFDR